MGSARNQLRLAASYYGDVAKSATP